MHESQTYWTRLLREQRRSGLSIVEFCRARGVSPSSFHRWRRMVADGISADARRATRPAFIECAPAAPMASPAMVIALRGGRRLEFPQGADDASVARFVVLLDRLDQEVSS